MIRRIGLFDSGLGGLTVLHEVRKAARGAELIYLGDTARTPYGSKSAPTIQRYSRECSDFLMRREIDLLIVACNTSSALALDELRENCACPVIGTIDAAVSAVCAHAPRGSVGVIGTEATIGSGVYERALRAALPEVKVTSVACPLFVPLVEQAMVEGEIVDKVIEHYLSSMRAASIDTLVLGCTHYPLLKNALQRFFGPKVHIVECSRAIADEVGKRCGQSGETQGRETNLESVEFFVTDEAERFSRYAKIFLGTAALAARHVEL